mgnify:CR=1 FL=1
MSMSVLDLVNILQGTDSCEAFSNGNTLPLHARPHGLAHWTVNTSTNTTWLFSPHVNKLHSMRLTHQPSPWMNDYAPLCVMPVTSNPMVKKDKVEKESVSLDDLPIPVTPEKRVSTFPPHLTKFAPHCFETFLMRWRIQMQFTPTERCGVFKFKFPANKNCWVVIDSIKSLSSVSFQSDSNIVSGYTTMNHGGVPENFKGYFAIMTNSKIVNFGAFSDSEGFPSVLEKTGDHIGCYIGFGAEDKERVIEIKVGTSFISVDQAIRNINYEVGDLSFEQVVDEGRKTWETLLNRIEIEGGTEKQQKTFYTSLYRSLLFPRKFYEYNESKTPIHYSPYTGNIHSGFLYADNGFWDTYRTVYPFLSLVYPEICEEIIQGLDFILFNFTSTSTCFLFSFSFINDNQK